MHRKVERLVIVKVVLIFQSVVAKDALKFSVLKRFFLDCPLKVEKWAKLGRDLLREALLELNFLLAARALHESERDAQGRPAVLEELYEAVGVENVAAGELSARLFAKLTRVADGAELVLVDTVKQARFLSAGRLEAGQAPLLSGDTLAGVSTAFVGLLAEGQGWLLLRHDHLLDDVFFFFVFFLFVFFLLHLELDIDLEERHDLVGGLASESRDASLKHRLHVLLIAH